MPLGARSWPEPHADQRNRPARIGQLPPHQHHQREAEEQEEQRGDRVLDADDLVIEREHVLAPEPELVVVMPVAVRVSVRVLAARMNAGFVHKRGRLYAKGTSGASCAPGRKIGA